MTTCYKCVAKTISKIQGKYGLKGKQYSYYYSLV